jgi:uncharacterized protein YigE (DUF2233 family)
VEQRQKPFSADIIWIDQLSGLSLYLYQTRNVELNFQQIPYFTFSNLQKSLKQQCKHLEFAMNAGMFHIDYSPVGLYVEQSKPLQALNTATEGFGNFLIQPNGVLAWNGHYLVYIPALSRNDAFRGLGPILAYTEPVRCK